MRYSILIAVALFIAPRAAVAQVPLDVLAATPRGVQVEIEGSSNLGVVGELFGPLLPATWSASGSTGTLTISATTHEQIRGGGGWTPVPGSFDPIVIDIDLSTLEATSQPASGALVSGNLSMSFTQNVLDTIGFGGFMGPDVSPFFCTSQQQVDEACLVAPQFCGQVCTPVFGVVYDPNSGLVNLVGSETQAACDGGQCFGPFDFFTGGGDLRLTEAPTSVPMLPPLAALALVALLAGLARV
jgi:hypothetical protein